MKKLEKKDDGSTFIDVIECIITVILLSFILILMFDYARVQSIYFDANAIARAYLHTMEVEGCLTDELRSDMQTKLEELGLSNISFDGTTFSSPEHGEIIVLNVNATYDNSISNRFLSGNEGFVISKYSLFKN